VSFEDLAPTVLSLASVPAPGHMTGRALMGDQRRPAPSCIFASRNRIDDTPDLCRSAMDGRFVYTRNYFPHLPVMKYEMYSDVADIVRTIRRDYAEGRLNAVQAELVEPTRPREYLYDLTADTWEIRNLADDPAHRGDLERLRRATADHIREVHDVMFLPERDMVARAGSSTPYERRADPAYNPLEAMLEAAALVGDPAAIPRQIALLDHDEDVVRYWAAVGLYAARRELDGHIDAVRSHLNDDAASVQIELSAALVAACGDAEARDALAAHIESDDVLLAHQALAKVLYMPEAAPQFAEAVERAHERLGEEGAGASTFPAQQAAEMYRYLYRGVPLYYADDARYIDPLDRVKDW
jgi:hypothetical protein